MKKLYLTIALSLMALPPLQASTHSAEDIKAQIKNLESQVREIKARLSTYEEKKTVRSQSLSNLKEEAEKIENDIKSHKGPMDEKKELERAQAIKSKQYDEEFEELLYVQQRLQSLQEKLKPLQEKLDQHNQAPQDRASPKQWVQLPDGSWKKNES